MNKLIDSHAHYYDRRYDNPAEGENADTLLQRIFSPESDVCGIINVGTNLTTSLLALEQTAHYPGMFAAVGLHPEDCLTIDRPIEELAKLRTLIGTPAERKEKKIVAIGEIGLDYYDRGIPLNPPLQRQVFETQLCWAQETGLPVIIHDRDAHGDCLETVLRYPGVHGVFHSFSGSAEMARELWRRGWMISFSGVVTFKNARRVQEVAASIPLKSLLVETDCPYLAPHPHRGRRNDSSLMHCTAEMLAKLHHISAEELTRITHENTCRLFGLEL